MHRERPKQFPCRFGLGRAGRSASLLPQPPEPTPSLTQQMVDGAVGQLDSIVQSVMSQTGRAEPQLPME